MADVVDAHEFALVLFGGLGGIINPDGLLSAIARPYNGHYRRIWSKAAALTESLIRNHPFTDGNKRTAVIVVHALLLHRSGFELRGTQQAFEDHVLQIAAGELTFDQIEDWFRQHVRAR